MKVNIRLHNATPGSLTVTPLEIQALSRPVAELLATLMRLHGIRVLTATPNLIGSCTVLEKQFVGLGEPPESIQAIRKEAVARMAAYMSLLGITQVEIQPDEQDMKVILDTWAKLKPPEGEVQAAKAAPTGDPTGQPVDGPK